MTVRLQAPYARSAYAIELLRNSRSCWSCSHAWLHRSMDTQHAALQLASAQLRAKLVLAMHPHWLVHTQIQQEAGIGQVSLPHIGSRPRQDPDTCFETKHSPDNVGLEAIKFDLLGRACGSIHEWGSWMHAMMKCSSSARSGI